MPCMDPHARCWCAGESVGAAAHGASTAATAEARFFGGSFAVGPAGAVKLFARCCCAQAVVRNAKSYEMVVNVRLKYVVQILMAGPKRDVIAILSSDPGGKIFTCAAVRAGKKTAAIQQQLGAGTASLASPNAAPPVTQVLAPMPPPHPKPITRRVRAVSC